MRQKANDQNTAVNGTYRSELHHCLFIKIKGAWVSGFDIEKGPPEKVNDLISDCFNANQTPAQLRLSPNSMQSRSGPFKV